MVILLVFKKEVETILTYDMGKIASLSFECQVGVPESKNLRTRLPRMILSLIILLFVPFIADGHTLQIRESSKPISLARQILLQAAGMVYPSQLEALLKIGKLQA